MSTAAHPYRNNSRLRHTPTANWPRKLLDDVMEKADDNLRAWANTTLDIRDSFHKLFYLGPGRSIAWVPDPRGDMQLTFLGPTPRSIYGIPSYLGPGRSIAWVPDPRGDAIDLPGPTLQFTANAGNDTQHLVVEVAGKLTAERSIPIKKEEAALLRKLWKKVRKARYDKVFADTNWKYSPGRDNKNLKRFLVRYWGSYIQAYRSGHALRKLPNLRIICVDPRLRIFAKLFDPITGDKFDARAGIDIISRLSQVTNLQEALDKILNEDRDVAVQRKKVERIRRELGKARSKQRESDDRSVSAKQAELAQAEQDLCAIQADIRKREEPLSLLQKMAEIQR
ncbi:hypothetical protein BDZ88DRAFT_508007 [Geranomyces variabilis]|nr:hypothetical protein BDZ88DRAFT_508007 [Geranomyces variabilis]